MRTRSEYRLSPIVAPQVAATVLWRQPVEADREGLARLMLDAYRGTIDDEGEQIPEALEAVDHYLTTMVREHSFVFAEGDTHVAFAFTVVVDDTYYVDPVVVASACKRRGIGHEAVETILVSLAAVGIDEVGATITDGNVASERLFTALGFRRTGSWS